MPICPIVSIMGIILPTEFSIIMLILFVAAHTVEHLSSSLLSFFDLFASDQIWNLHPVLQ